jgi:hypothetical protein
VSIDAFGSVMIVAVRAKQGLEMKDEKIGVFLIVGDQLDSYLLLAMSVAAKCAILAFAHSMRIHYTKFIAVFFDMVSLFNLVVRKLTCIFHRAGSL